MSATKTLDRISRIRGLIKRAPKEKPILASTILPRLNKVYSKHSVMGGLQKEIDQTFKPNMNYNHVSAFTGDDSVVMTDNPLVGTLPISIASAVLRLKISWSDVIVSKLCTNYAEEFILLPFSTKSGWSGTRNGAGSKHAPLILDPVKLRSISAVRKQSDEDMNLSSKFRDLAVRANWCNTDWLSYNGHQLALVLGLTCFDFRSERDFPFLDRGQGGIGGKPPWNSLETVRNTLFYFNSGRSTKVVVGLMREAIDAVIGTQTNDELMLHRAVHLAAHDPKAWIDLNSKILTAKNAGYTERQIREITSTLNEDFDIPHELEEKAIDVAIEDTLTGGIISYLRSAQYIMTELDVMVHAFSEQRINGIKGDIPMARLHSEQEEAMYQAKKTDWTKLSGLINSEKRDRDRCLDFLKDLPDLQDPTIFDVMEEYYETFSDSRLGSISFSPYQKIFQSSDVREHYDVKARAILAASMFPKGIFSYADETWQVHNSREKQLESEQIRNWLKESWDQDDPLVRNIPFSIGVTDPLLLAQVDTVVAQYRETNVIFALVTADIKLQGLLKKRALKYDKLAISVDPKHYAMWCLDPDPRGDGYMWNAVKNTKTRFPKDAQEQFNMRIYSDKALYIIWLLDIPNIRGAVADYNYDFRGRLVTMTGGWFVGKYDSSHRNYDYRDRRMTRYCDEISTLKHQMDFKRTRRGKPKRANHNQGIRPLNTRQANTPEDIINQYF